MLPSGIEPDMNAPRRGNRRHRARPQHDGRTERGRFRATSHARRVDDRRGCIPWSGDSSYPLSVGLWDANRRALWPRGDSAPAGIPADSPTGVSRKPTARPRPTAKFGGLGLLRGHCLPARPNSSFPRLYHWCNDTAYGTLWERWLHDGSILAGKRRKTGDGPTACAADPPAQHHAKLRTPTSCDRTPACQRRGRRS